MYITKPKTPLVCVYIYNTQDLLREVYILLLLYILYNIILFNYLSYIYFIYIYSFNVVSA